MFLGHFALGFAAKRAAPEVSLGAMVLGVQLPDLVWPFLLLSGTETVTITKGETPFLNLEFTHYPYSHSAVSMVLMGLGLAAIWALLCRRRTWRGAILLLLAVLSHWLLDWLMHRPDLPIGFDGGKLGLGLWRQVPLTLGLEFGLFAIGMAVYARSTKPESRTGTWAMAAMAGFLAVVYWMSFTGPPPPDTRTLALVGLSAWLFPLWAWWIDRHRSSRLPSFLSDRSSAPI